MMQLYIWYVNVWCMCRAQQQEIKMKSFGSIMSITRIFLNSSRRWVAIPGVFINQPAYLWTSKPSGVFVHEHAYSCSRARWLNAWSRQTCNMLDCTMSSSSFCAGYSHCQTKTSSGCQGKGRWNACWATGFCDNSAAYRYNIRFLLAWAPWSFKLMQISASVEYFPPPQIIDA